MMHTNSLLRSVLLLIFIGFLVMSMLFSPSPMDGKVKSLSDSNENSFEIFVAAAEQAEPVVEVNGMRRWINRFLLSDIT